MGRKNKNIMGGAASGAAAGTSVMPGWGTAIGAGLGAIMGSQDDDEARQIAPAVPQEVVDKLYRQANGAETTVGELKAAQLFDKSLAQQIAGAKAQRGVNPALLQRNVSRIAAEQSQAGAAAAAEVAAQERAKAMQQYLTAQQMNSGINAQNVGLEMQADKQANNMLAAGLNAGAGAAGLYSQRSDAEKQLAAQEQKAATASNSVKDPINTSNLNLGSGTQQAQAVNSAYGLGANTDLSSYLPPKTSDSRTKKNVKYDSMKVVSDERQKDLVKTEDLPSNNNMGMQNMQAMQPAAPMAQGAPMSQGSQMPQSAAAPATTAAPEASKLSSSTFGLTPEMLAQAQKSSKGGGNVSDIQNQGMTLKRAAAGPSADEILQMSMDAQARQTRDVFGNVTQSDDENYQANLNRWHQAAAAQNAAYDKESGEVNLANMAKDAERTSRLNRFYTGIDTGAGAVASQFAPKVVTPASDWGSAQAAQNAAGIGNQSKNTGAFQRDFLQQWDPAGRYGLSGSASLIAQQNPILEQLSSIKTSDERQKKQVEPEQSKSRDNFNPKSFLDKLDAVSWEYKNSAKGKPGVTDGRHLGVMAQDLEKAGPVGESMVDEDASGTKVVDYGAGFSAILASQAHLNKRLEGIEKMYAKKKKE